MEKTRRRWDRIDRLLAAGIAGLSALLLAELTAPALVAWRNRARPGAQVCREYAAKGLSEGGGSDGGSGSAGTARARIRYLVYLPRDYSKEKQWPLVVFLHGAGEGGDDLEKVRQVGLPKLVERGEDSPVASLVLNRFLVVSPQCATGRGWDAGLVLEMVEEVCRGFAVDRQRVYLTGYSMGGFGTWEIGCREPGRFAAIAPLCGGGAPSEAERLKDLPVWAFHGAKDEVVPLSASQRMVEAVRKAGGCAELTVYADEGHGIADVTYEDPRLYEWLLKQRCGEGGRKGPKRP